MKKNFKPYYLLLLTLISILSGMKSQEIIRQVKNILLIMALLTFFACIKSFDPQIESNVKNKFVISGRVTSTEGWQVVIVSLSSPIENPEYIPVEGCQMNILDNKGNTYPMEENEPGTYQTWIGQGNLAPGTAFKLTLLTPDGETIESSYDTLFQAAPLDSVYYLVEEYPTTDPSIYNRGMQFYVDINGSELDSRNYKWEIVETWEEHAAHAAENYYDGDWHTIDPPDSSNMVCWNTVPIKSVYTVSTKSLSENTYLQYPLQFIDEHNSRLAYHYSILINQLGLSEGAYHYWEQVRVNSTEQGGLYEKQPLSIKGNMVNLTKPENEVLGYFYACSESERRYFYSDIEGLDQVFHPFCQEDPLGRKGWKDYDHFYFPIYYYFNQNHLLRILTWECVDCRVFGGTTEKPDFWPY